MSPDVITPVDKKAMYVRHIRDATDGLPPGGDVIAAMAGCRATVSPGMPGATPADRTYGLSIRLLGDFCVSTGSRTIDELEWTSRKAKKLVKLLALAPRHRLHREHVMDRLWPEMEIESAANNLHKALYFARRVLEPGLPRHGTSLYLQLCHDFVVLDAPDALWVDVEAFQAAASMARLTRTPHTYEEALRLYTGDLVPEDHYEDWVIAYREQLRELRLALLVELATLQDQSGDIGVAIETLQQVVAIDPAHEEAHGALMRLLALTGRRHLALRQYQHLCAALRRELDAEPDASLQALNQSILSGRLFPQALPSSTNPFHAVHVSPFGNEELSDGGNRECRG